MTEDPQQLPQLLANFLKVKEAGNLVDSLDGLDESIVDDVVDYARYGELLELISFLLESPINSKKPILSRCDDDEVQSSRIALPPYGSPSKILTHLFTSPSTLGGGYSALHVSAANNQTEVLEFLLHFLTSSSDLSLSSSLPTSSGDTPLHWASVNGSTDCVKLLLAAGADATLKNNSGRSSVTVAEQQNHLEIVNLLLATFEPGEDVTGSDNPDQADPLEDENLSEAERINRINASTQNMAEIKIVHADGSNDSAKIN